DGVGPGARNHDRTMAMLVTTQATSATQIHTLPIHSTNGKESARPRYMQATEYIPSGKTMLHKVGVYRSGTRRKKCRHTPTAISTGISHVANAHNTTAPPAMRPRTASTIGPLCISTMRAPATILMAMAPIDTQ